MDSSVSLPLSEDQSFEVSEWFQIVKDRLDNIQRKQTAQRKWIRIAKRYRRQARRANLRRILDLSYDDICNETERDRMAQLWRSLASRFTKQMQFKVMNEYATNVRRERARTQQKFRDMWQILAEKLMLETRIAGFSRAKAITEHYLGLWQDFAEETLLNARVTINWWQNLGSRTINMD